MLSHFQSTWILTWLVFVVALFVRVFDSFLSFFLSLSSLFLLLNVHDEYLSRKACMRKQTDDEEKSQQNLCTPVFKSPTECYSIKSVDRAHTEYVCRINAVKHEAHRLACQFAREFDLLRISIALPRIISVALA